LKKITECLNGTLALGLILTPVWGHHSFSGTYKADAPPEEIRGTLRSFNVRNPHSFVRYTRCFVGIDQKARLKGFVKNRDPLCESKAAPRRGLQSVEPRAVIRVHRVVRPEKIREASADAGAASGVSVMGLTNGRAQRGAFSRCPSGATRIERSVLLGSYRAASRY
jgi:hypothetical protein